MTTALQAPRLERLYGVQGPTEDELKAKVPDELQNVQCLQCGGLMTLIKAFVRKNDFLTTTYQCHTQKAGKMCLFVLQATNSVPFYMRPQDFDDGDVSVLEKAHETIPAKDVEKLVVEKKITPKATFEGVPEKPIYPGDGKRTTINTVLWNFFWDTYMDKGKVPKDALEKIVRETKSKPGDRKLEAKIDAALSVQAVKDLITSRSGYVVRLSDGHYDVTGKTRGAKGFLGEPWSTDSYKKTHGFPL